MDYQKRTRRKAKREKKVTRFAMMLMMIFSFVASSSSSSVTNVTALRKNNVDKNNFRQGSLGQISSNTQNRDDNSHTKKRLTRSANKNIEDVDGRNNNPQRRLRDDVEFDYSLQHDDTLSSESSNKKEKTVLKTYLDDDEVLPFEFQKPEVSSSWYMLSRYVDPNSILYDTIEGFLVASCVCLVIASCYHLTYYSFWVKCLGCCPDDRILYRQKLLRKGIVPRRFWNQFGKITLGTNKYFSTRLNRRHDLEQDGKGLFTPIHILPDAYHDDDDDNDDDDDDDYSQFYSGSECHSIQRIGVPSNRSHDESLNDSSLSDDDSMLSMEFGDVELHDEYGEVTDRLEDNKLVDAARNYFEREETNQNTKEQQKKKNKNKNTSKVPILQRLTNKLINHTNGDNENYTNASSQKGRRKRRERRAIKSSNSHRSNQNSATKSVDVISFVSGKSKASQKSILSSSSDDDDNYSGSNYTSSDGEGELEVEHAMMDLELVEQKLVQNRQNNTATLAFI